MQLKDLLLATYFAADHVVWAFQIGLIQDKTVGERAQKVSLWGWALGSVLTMVIEANNIVSVSADDGTTHSPTGKLSIAVSTCYLWMSID